MSFDRLAFYARKTEILTQEEEFDWDKISEALNKVYKEYDLLLKKIELKE